MPGTDPVAVIGMRAVGTLLAVALAAAGHHHRYPAERYMREAKVLQIFEGTNQIRRLIISRRLQSDHTKH
jgi:alkylation response protein AidB-like acyl-CoA dehydrogenase